MNDHDPTGSSEAAPPSQDAGPPAQDSRRAYAQILITSALIGGTGVLNTLLSIVRTKLLAVLLGPAGFGLQAAFTAISDMARSWTEFGINSSGVRQIAEANGTQEQQRIALTVVVLRRTAIVLGLLGALALVLLSHQVARLTFGDDAHAGAVALLGLVVFFRMVSDGQTALLQGLRRIGDLARSSLIGTAFGAVILLAVVFWTGERGLALALVLSTAATTVVMWWYARRVKVERVEASVADIRREAFRLLRLGLAFMTSSLLMMGATYAVRLILIRVEGLHAAGIYQAAWTLGGLYVGLILQAMGTDFYPRLVGACKDDAETNRMVNQQMRASLLLAGPGVLATLVFAPIAITLFYTAEFAPAAQVLRWICMGMAMRTLSWPMGYIIVARNRQVAFIATEVAWTIANVGATLVLVERWGMNGAGVAFLLSYVLHTAILLPIVRRMSGFRCEKDIVVSGAALMLAMGAVTAAYALLPPILAIAFGLVLTLVACIHSVRCLATLVPPESVPRRLHFLIQRRRQADVLPLPPIAPEAP